MGEKTKPVHFFLVLLSLIILVSLFNTGLSTTEPPDDPEPVLKLKLELEDVSCTEECTKLAVSNVQLYEWLNLNRTDTDGNTVTHISILKNQDSLSKLITVL